MAEVKPEIKLDPSDSPAKLADVDDFEEDTDLYIPPKEVQDQGAWLVKVSEDMWKAWNHIYHATPEDTHELEIAKLRVYKQKPGEDTQRIQIRLQEGYEAYTALPMVYNLEMKAAGYNNTVVFSEKDLPGHRTQQFGANRYLQASRPSGIPSKMDRYGQRKPGGYRTVIPKQTALAPPIVNEMIAKPVEDDTSMDIFKRQYDAALAGGKKTTFLTSINKTQHPAMIGSGFTFGSMTSKPGSRKKVPKEKAVRMTKEELLDALGRCYQQYSYWSLKSLRNHLHQPEAFIKEVLEEIAVLMRSGDYMGNYKLTASSLRLLQAQASELKEEAAPIKNEDETDQGTGDEMGEGDDDDDMNDFEDVKMEGSGQ